MGDPEMALSKSELDLQPDSVRYEYEFWLLDDHPLRSYPTECIPGLGPFLVEWCSSLQKRQKERLFRTGCLLLACFVAYQCLQLLPSRASWGVSHPALLSRASPRDWQVKCTFPNSDPRPSALAQSVAAGCGGFRIDLWLHGTELQTGPVHDGPSEENDLRVRLDSLLGRLKPRDAALDPQAALNADAVDDTIDGSVARSFLLVLDAKTSLRELHSYLVSDLDALRQRGDLSHWNGVRIVQRSVTIIVTGTHAPASDCSSSAYSDIFFRSSEDEVLEDGFSTDHLSPICVI
ncbi:uncharacterized protein N7459_008843 [Penicillium hispanicum]|uniref:uncharacterized protein n=1 Tax=Penicillium hispanicum TaxID=1080232 RepID=UPI00253FC70F|nr:uncharacterized protein N7459_008843 [Penicillium hispanicum]KAJ5569413.1 hypothetical protein N7459_008843 [Penicillium hispanicum]